MDYVLKNAEQEHENKTKGSKGYMMKLKESRRIEAEYIFDLDFADDIALLEGGGQQRSEMSTLERTQSQLTTTANWARRVGLEINIKKTEVFSNQEHIGPSVGIGNQQFIKLEGHNIAWTKNFKYLGSHIASSESDIQIRKGQAWGAFWKMKDVFTSRTLPIKLKIDIFEAACIPILLYGCESWIITKKLARTLNSYATNCYRIMLGIRKIDKVSNKDVYDIVNRQQLTLRVQQRQLRFVGHSLRRDKNDLINKYVLYASQERHGRRSRGRGRKLYHQYIGELVNQDVPAKEGELRVAAENRDIWRRFCNRLKTSLFSAD